MDRKASPIADLWIGVLFIVTCAVVLWETRDIPPGTFEPLGSAPIPQAVAVLIILLTLVIMAKAWLSLKRGETAGDAQVPPRYADAAMLCALTVAYVTALHLRIGRFDVLTTIFLFITIGILVRFGRKSLLTIGIVSAITGFGAQYAFTQVFVVDLPGAF
jgi:hypothetical protein